MSTGSFESRAIAAATRLGAYFRSHTYAGDWPRALMSELIALHPTAWVLIHLHGGHGSAPTAGGWLWQDDADNQMDEPAWLESHRTSLTRWDSVIRFRQADTDAMRQRGFECGRVVGFRLEVCRRCTEAPSHERPTWVEWCLRSCPPSLAGSGSVLASLLPTAFLRLRSVHGGQDCPLNCAGKEAVGQGCARSVAASPVGIGGGR